MHESPLTRRELLKILAAAGGAAALLSVPNQWKTPVVEIGALPAHAQGSSFGTITGTISTEATGPRSNVDSTPSVRAQVSSFGSAPHITVLGTVLATDGLSSGPHTWTYSIPNVPPGTYTVNCFYYVDNPRTGVVITGGHTTVVDFTFAAG